jgi:asparagine synthetase B (glutamine-hydrolysing)
LKAIESGSLILKDNGHFIVIIWDNDKSIKIYNDLIGFRTIYLFNQNHRIIFSTELMWITKLVKNPTINLKAFGSRWLTFNQLSHKCLINGIEKLTPGEKIEIGINKNIIDNKNWIPDKIESTAVSFTNCLLPFLFPESDSNFPITLGFRED